MANVLETQHVLTRTGYTSLLQGVKEYEDKNKDKKQTEVTMNDIPYGKDPEDAPLGTHTYRCKGCNGKNCRVCCFGDMWEQDTDNKED